MQALLVDCVEKLQQNYPKIKGGEKFILLTSTTTSTEGALYYVESCGILNKLKEKNIKLEKIISTDLVPAAISKNGELIIPVAIDYLLWTKEVSSAFEKIKSSYKKNSKKNSVVLALKGRTSDLAMSNLVSQKVKVIQQVY
jgi:hypothetical protein